MIQNFIKEHGILLNSFGFDENGNKLDWQIKADTALAIDPKTKEKKTIIVINAYPVQPLVPYYYNPIKHGIYNSLTGRRVFPSYKIGF